MFVSPCSHVQQSVKLVTELLWVFWCIYVQFDPMNEMSKSFSSKKVFSYGIRANFQTLPFLGFIRSNLGIFTSSSTIVAFFKLFQVSSMADTTAANTSTIESSSLSQDSYNFNDPLFLHPGENPGAVLTSQPLIGGENYPAWARSVRKSLIAKNKLGFINGSLIISSPLVNSPTATQAWIRADNMVGTWIINSVSPKL